MMPRTPTSSGCFSYTQITKGLDDMPPKNLETTKVEVHVMNADDYAAFEKQTKEAHDRKMDTIQVICILILSISLSALTLVTIANIVSKNF